LETLEIKSLAAHPCACVRAEKITGEMMVDLRENPQSSHNSITPDSDFLPPIIIYINFQQ
jgi:hypothetical protein